MKSPKLYTIRKLTLQNFINFSREEIEDINGKVKKKSVHKLNNNIILTEKEEKEYKIKQQHNHLFRIIENNKTITNDYIPDVVFVDCKNNKNYIKELDGILRKGIVVNGVAFKYWGKSASMSRNGILGFVSLDMYDIVESHAMMDIEFDKTVLSKFEAYKCLLLSSCFCIEEPLPYMIVVDDFEDTVKDVNIKYVDEKEIEYIDKKTNETKIFKEKIIKEGIKDVDICFNDGSGFISLEYANKIKECLQLDYVPSAEMLRIPYTKGLGITVDFKGYYKEHNIEYLTDLWGKKHKVEDIDVVLTKSQYKGYKYFKKKGDYSDWEGYLALLKKYNYCMGIAKVNYSLKDEPKMTRCNYQTLQTLDITSEELIEVSSYTRKWIERILNGDLLYVYKYLGISENTEPINDYMKAIILNPQMIHDIKIKSYLYGLLRKTIDEVKIGKIHIKGAFKFLIPDVIMMLEYIGGLKVKGCLKNGEMFAVNHSGEYVLNRNPHLSRSEHVILNAVNNKSTNRWCSHLEGCCMINSKDVTAPRLNGADQDGDLVIVHNNKGLKKGIHRDLPIVLDIEDKITAKELPYDLEHIIEFTKASLDSRIGEISNCASSYMNKYAKDEEIKKKYDDFCCLLSVINGKEIDYAKTGVRWNVPTKISKYARPLPYFLKYKYPKQNKHNMSRTKMNEHCWFIEKWERGLRFNNDFVNTSYCMIDNNIEFNQEKYDKVVEIFNKCRKEYKNLKDEERMAKNFDNYKDFFDGLSKFEVENTNYDWDKFYNRYRKEFETICCQNELTNYLVQLIYNNLNGSYYNILWEVCKKGILENLNVNRVKPILVPVESEDNIGTEYLGRYYKLVEYKGEI